MKFYLIPIESVTVGETTMRGPKYFKWGGNPAGITCRWSMMDYGFVPSALLLAHDISDIDHAALILNADVFAFPDNLDAPVVPNSVTTFFAAINLPTDWLVSSTTYRELLRQVAGMMQFNQRYGGISGGHSIFENATLSTRLRQMTVQEQAWFLATVDSFGYDSSTISTNSQLSLLVKQAANYWSGQSFIMGGIVF